METVMKRVKMLSRLTGMLTEWTEPYSYVSAPTTTQIRVVFQDRTCLSYAEAEGYARQLYAAAYLRYVERFGPFSRAATEQVELWIANDSWYIESARGAIGANGIMYFSNRLCHIMRMAPEGSAAWHAHRGVRDTGATVDQVNWLSVAKTLLMGMREYNT